MFIKKNKTQKNKKIGFICLLALWFVIVIFGIVYYANNIKYQKQPESPEMAKLKKFLIENGEEFKIPKVNTLTWETFRDKEHGFKFKYPRGWVVEKSDENSWGLKEIWNIRNPEDDEPCSQPKGCWDDSGGEVDYIRHGVVNFSIFDTELLEKNLKTENVDYSEPEIATEDGVVVESSDGIIENEGRITIDHKNGFYSDYFDLESRSVEVGDIVKKGQEIGIRNFEKYQKTKTLNLDVNSFFNSINKQSKKDKSKILYGFVDKYIYIYDGSGELYLFLDLNKTMLVYNSYSGEKSKEYFKIYYGVLKTLKFD